MKSRIILRDNQAFTLFEILIVMSLVLIVGSFSLYFGIDNMRGYYFIEERDSLISTLQHTRALSVSNICYGICTESMPHGVYIKPEGFTLFQGETYSSADHTFDIVTEMNPNISYEGSDEIIFTKLTGEVSTIHNLTLTDKTSGKTSEITIEPEGRISWTN